MYKIIVNSQKQTYSAVINDFNYIVHHGIKGQRWGVRRFQNQDGSYTPAGKERYNHGNSNSSIKGVKDPTINKSVSSHMEFAQKMKEHTKNLKQLKSNERDLDKAISNLDKEYSSNQEVIKFYRARNELGEKLWEEARKSGSYREYNTRLMNFSKEYGKSNPKYKKITDEYNDERDKLLKKESDLYTLMDKESKNMRKDLGSEIKKNPIFKEYDDARKNLDNVREETIGRNSKAYNDAYKKYVDSGKISDYGFDHYMWRESEWGPDYGCKEYDAAAKEYKQKSKGYESKMEESEKRLKADVLKGMTSDKQIAHIYDMALYDSYYDR